jgi:hypothetical protein
MGKLIFWLFVVFGVLFGLRLINTGKAKRRASDANKTGIPAETMVRCGKCGVFLPLGDARPVADGYLCSDPECIKRR